MQLHFEKDDIEDYIIAGKISTEVKDIIRKHIRVARGGNKVE